MTQQMEQSLKLGRKLIDTELDTGILNFIVRPVVKAFYDYWACLLYTSPSPRDRS